MELIPDDVNILDALGEACLQANLVPQAHAAWTKSIELSPNGNPHKYLNLAQIVEGTQAEEYTLSAINIMLQSSTSDENQKLVCDAYCSLAELYVTDLCDDENAEKMCEDYLLKAMSHDVGSPEPMQGYANLRIIQNRGEEAAKFIYEAYIRLCNIEEQNGAVPSMEFRIVTGKLLMETNQFNAAAEVLEGVMAEDDENAELWYLVGKCYLALEDSLLARDFLTKCSEMLLKLKKNNSEFNLESQLAEVLELIRTTLK